MTRRMPFARRSRLPRRSLVRLPACWLTATVCWSILWLSSDSLPTAASGRLQAAESETTVELKGIEFFEKKIRPVLVQHCYQCHASDAKELGGKLRLDTRAGLLAGGESGPAVVPGVPKQSLLIRALRYDGLEMPPKKRLPESVVADFVKWVQIGAPDPRIARPDELAGKKNGTGADDVTPDIDSGRDFWSFRPIAKPAVPNVRDTKWGRSAIDRFVLARLEEAGLRPAPDADPRTLARRLHYDLIGLPPTVEQVDAFVREHGKNRQAAVERLVDELLRSPQFGERWARHWLDVARYGESNGNVRNSTFPHAWRYRDYVIGAFNADKPYDQFVAQQVAGDLMPYATPEQRNENLVATGFLAIGSKPNAQGNANFQMDVVADQIEVVTTSVLALTVACARCHDHKYDPVPTRDYYSLAGIFTSTETLYGAAGNNMGGAPPTPLHVLAKGPTSDPADAPSTSAADAPAAAAAPPGDGAGKKKNKAGKKGKKPAQAAEKTKAPPGATLAMGVRDREKPADCRINLKGESKQLGASVPRGFIQVCTIGEPPRLDERQSGRLQLAQWLTSADNPLTARVAVNRIWHHLFGQGIVRSPDNFGLHGERPTHPELLDFLARRLIEHGWSFKRTIREIVLSRTYQIGGQFDDRAFVADPDNMLHWRHNRRRLDAESFRDSVLAVSGRLDLRPAEGSLVAKIGEALIQDKLTPDKIQKPSDHRSVYLCMLRSGEPDELLVFDLADPSLIVGARNVTTVPAQALFLLNSPFVVEQSKQFAQRLLAEGSADDSAQDDARRIESAYLRSLARRPTPDELARGKEFLAKAAVQLEGGPSEGDNLRLRIWSGYCQSLLAASEFRYVD